AVEQHHAQIGQARFIDAGDGHGIGVVDFALARRFEPEGEQREGIDIAFEGVVEQQVGERGRHGRNSITSGQWRGPWPYRTQSCGASTARKSWIGKERGATENPWGALSR